MSIPEATPGAPKSPYAQQLAAKRARPTVLKAPEPPKDPKQRRTRAVKIVSVIAGVSMLAVLGFGALQFLRFRALAVVDNGQTVTDALSLDANSKRTPDPSRFLKPGDGRFSIAILGKGGAGHPGGGLTDSLQILSLDPLTNQATLASIPRDLYVAAQGTRMKINSVYQAAEQKKAGTGGAAIRETLEQVTGAEIHGFVLIDFEGVIDVVNALGGITVDVPEAITDLSYPAANQIDYAPFRIKAGVQTLNGETALKYARSRKTTSDFDRSARQQLIIQAVRDKALSAGVITNPKKLNDLTTALGKHFQTDLATSLWLSVMKAYGETEQNTTSAVLDHSLELGLLTSTNDPTAGYILTPKMGFGKYEAINTWYAKQAPDPLIAREAATVTLQPAGATTAGQLEALAQRLEAYGFKVVRSTEKSTDSTTTIRGGNQAQVSRNYLASILGIPAKGDNGPLTISYVAPRGAATATPKPSPSPSSTP